MKSWFKVVGSLSLTFIASCAPEAQTPAATSTAPDALSADPGHYTVEFENEAIQVIRIAYGAGERSIMHSHPANCTVLLTDTRFRMTPSSGEATTDEGTAGDVACGDAYAHLPENVGDEAQVAMIAMKGRDAFEGAETGPPVTGFSGVPDAVLTDRQHYAIEFENDLLRVLRVRYGPGEQSVMHTHPAGCAIFLTEQNVHFTLPDGTIEESLGTGGEVTCSDASLHWPQNVADQPLELVLVELKNRETFD